MKYQCRICGQAVIPKDGKLSCCGITETQSACDAENKRYNRVATREIKKQFSRCFNPIADYEDFPNED